MKQIILSAVLAMLTSIPSAQKRYAYSLKVKSWKKTLLIGFMALIVQFSFAQRLRKLIRIVVQMLLIFLCANNAYSQWGAIKCGFKKAGRAVKTAGKVTVKGTVAPYKTIYNTGKVVTRKGSLKTIYKPYTDISKTVGSGIPNAVDLLNKPNDFLYQQALKFSGNFGNTGKFIFDVSTFTNQLSNQLGVAGSNSAGNTIRGQNPLQVVAAPLAAAIRAARQRHLAEAKPLPVNIKQALLNYFPRSILDKAKYCQGDIQITLPNFIGRGQKWFGDIPFAVTVGDIIVFNVTPPLEPNNLKEWHWWIHEITHLQQYEKMGIERFAFNYILDHGSLENEADERADLLLQFFQ